MEVTEWDEFMCWYDKIPECDRNMIMYDFWRANVRE